LDLIGKANDPLADSLRGITALNPYGVDIRYPGDFPQMSVKDAEIAVDLAKKVQAVIMTSLQDYLNEGS
jgi:hypothetical protein